MFPSSTKDIQYAINELTTPANPPIILRRLKIKIIQKEEDTHRNKNTRCTEDANAPSRAEDNDNDANDDDGFFFLYSSSNDDK